MIDHYLHKAVVADPDNDQPRLMMADWLDELGDPRGEFIRIQIRLARDRLSDPERIRLEQQQRELLQAHRRRWNGPLHQHLCTTTDLRVQGRRGGLRGWTYQRGFASEITVDAAAFVAWCDRILEIGPIQQIRFVNLYPLQDTVLGLPALAQMRSISLGSKSPNRHLDGSLVGAVASSKQLSQLRSLNISRCYITRPCAIGLTESPALGRLERLVVKDCPMTVASARMLVERFGDSLVFTPSMQFWVRDAFKVDATPSESRMGLQAWLRRWISARMSTLQS